MIDRILATLGMVVLSPLFAILALLVRFSLGGPILFRQQRPGRYGQPFTILKFRTMTNQRDAGGALLPDEQRLHRLGRILRTTSLDELPELWNVLRGDLSLVGPRPLLTQYLGRYSPAQARRHDVLPGITGWAQIRGRNAIDWEQKLALDVWYVDHWSLLLDLRILLVTLGHVISREGIAHHGYATMPEFMGDQRSRGASG